MSKKLFHDLRKLELIFTSEELKEEAIKKYGTSVITYWKNAKTWILNRCKGGNYERNKRI